jgi:uncharacterized membrane protein
MKDKLKAFWFYLTTTVAAILAFIAYYSYRKDKEVKQVKEGVDNLKTEKEADILDAEINKLKKEAEDSKKLRQEFDKAQAALDEKREQIIKDSKTPKSAQEVAKYWEEN